MVLSFFIYKTRFNLSVLFSNSPFFTCHYNTIAIFPLSRGTASPESAIAD
ncbi:MAG: hypothetical protein HWQ43_17725 [Nostoc sp. JL31]|nr:hypothetical protein [Nostoc sp. JL31]MBN3890906.1 hypothetical protein [Nostoc sp. JL31]